jgi:hypothetical protein
MLPAHMLLFGATIFVAVSGLARSSYPKKSLELNQMFAGFTTKHM